MATIIFSFCLTGLLGCGIPMMGGGEVYIGIVDNMLKIGHRVDKDLEGVTAKIALEVEASVLEAILGTNDEPNDEVSSPGSTDPGE
jgi:hypothetical protein